MIITIIIIIIIIIILPVDRASSSMVLPTDPRNKLVSPYINNF